MELTNKTILITGFAGFIGANLVMKLIKTGESTKLDGLDNMNDNNDVRPKNTVLLKMRSLLW